MKYWAIKAFSIKKLKWGKNRKPGYFQIKIVYTNYVEGSSKESSEQVIYFTCLDMDTCG